MRELVDVVGPNRILCMKNEVLVYECDGQTLFKNPPDLVVFPTSTEEVSKIVRICRRQGVPYLPRGAGTALSGSAVASKGGVVIAFSRMNHILDVDFENHRAVVEPYVTASQITAAASKRGFFYAPDPASYTVSTIAGNLAHNAGGNHCIKYGVTTNHILGLKIVLPNGQVLELGGKVPDPPGYDLVGLVVGSEGTLGVVTEVTVKMLQKPPGSAALLTVFDSVVDASNAVSATIAAGIVPAAMEFMDQLAMKAVESGVKACGLPVDAEAIVLFEVEGGPDELDLQGQRIAQICTNNHARRVEVAKDPAGMAKLWAGRKAAFGSIGNIAPAYLVDDGTIPRSRLPEVITKIRQKSEETGLPIANVFHAGEGNLHPLIVYDPRKEEEAAKALKAGLDILRLCLEVGGTITGEHGVGLEKRELMTIQYTEAELNRMRFIKEIFDSDGLCNPGKVLPEQETSAVASVP